MKTMDVKIGSLYTFSAYLLWGFLTIYWKALGHVSAMEILAHRIVWSFVFMIILLLCMKQFDSFIQELRKLMHQPKNLLGISAATLLISANWFLFIWAVSNNHVLQASLGYYINPLVSILLGIVVLHEKVTFRQGTAFGLAAIGVIYLTLSSGVFPWISIVLAVTFASYGLLKKKINLSASHGLTIETMLIAPFAGIYLLSLREPAFRFSPFAMSDNLLLIGGGIVTAIPLLLFSIGAKAIPLSMVGILQFITPTIMLLLGVFVYQEAFSITNLIAFIFIWSALFLYLSTVYYRPAHRTKQRINH
ncbi:EamA family transporter RarD [Oceanobacillus sp. FSL H7-0719]|uniref:EamA family transporter RarD n=1 Tax=Oceanobacillus sp. FSL H7-0719 TaxID=2954507 RepID=UPI0032556705